MINIKRRVMLDMVSIINVGGLDLDGLVKYLHGKSSRDDLNSCSEFVFHVRSISK